VTVPGNRAGVDLTSREDELPVQKPWVRFAGIGALGTEAVGHTGEVATMVLTPDVVNAVRPLPCSLRAESDLADRSPHRWRLGLLESGWVGMADHN
jgi:hypothetical protein